MMITRLFLNLKEWVTFWNEFNNKIRSPWYMSILSQLRSLKNYFLTSTVLIPTKCSCFFLWQRLGPGQHAGGGSPVSWSTPAARGEWQRRPNGGQVTTLPQVSESETSKNTVNLWLPRKLISWKKLPVAYTLSIPCWF